MADIVSLRMNSIKNQIQNSIDFLVTRVEQNIPSSNDIYNTIYLPFNIKYHHNKKSIRKILKCIKALI